MSKVLLTADIHIFDYTTHSPSNRFRLYQNRVVVQNIIDVAKREGCEYLVLAGDIIDRPILTPNIQIEVKRFLDTLSPNFKTIYLILGQHDKNSKANNSTIEDSVLSVMLPDNVIYSHQQVFNFDGVSVGFSDWQPTFNLDWIKVPVDILITHATINYGNSDIYKSQELDTTKFKSIVFAGDIHHKTSKVVQIPDDKIGDGTRTYVSIGSCVRNKMRDQEESSGVIIDFSTHNWCHVNLNPYDNLLKFVYTDKLEEEGYKQDTNTWVVYKPNNIKFGSKNKDIEIDTWSEIESLVTEAVIKSGLEEIHTDVLKNINNSNLLDDVDFSFTIKRLRCENWRSITKADIKFEKGDKIYLSGSNGSGKSSLLSALSYALMDVSSTQGLVSLKPFIQYGKSYCWTEVEFEYQGNEYKLRRGTNSKDNSLWINGEEQKYNNKRAFEEDVRNRFKFTQYLFDCLFYSSEHHRFIGGMSSERKTEIMSKFLKLDKIDTLHNTSQIMLDNVRKERTNWVNKINETEKIIKYIQDKLNSIQLPELSKYDLENLKTEGLELQRKNKAWTEYITKTANLQGKIQTYTNTLNSLREKQNSFRSISVIDSEIEAINQEIQKMNGRMIDLGNIRVNLDYKNKEYNNLRNEGNNAWIEAQGLSIGRKCNSCGQVIQNTADMENHRQELLRKVEELKPKVQALQQEINELEYLKNNSDQEYNQINSDIQRLNSEISKRMTEKSIIDNTQKDIINYQQLLDRTNNELNSLGYVEKVELPSDFLNRMSNIESGINSWNQYESNKKDLDERTNDLNNLMLGVQNIEQYFNALDTYSRLTGPLGIIYEEILNKLSEAFSDNTVVYKVVRSGKGVREHLDLVPMLKKGNDDIEYFSCSSGEKTFIDLHLLDKLISTAGILVLDETLKNLDVNRMSEALELISCLKVNLLILTSHSESVNGFYNKTINLSINEQGLTEIN